MLLYVFWLLHHLLLFLKMQTLTKHDTLCPSDYSKQNMNTTVTLSRPDDLWSVLWQLTCLFSVRLCRHTHLQEEALVRPIIGGTTAKPVTGIYMTNEEQTTQQNSGGNCTNALPTPAKNRDKLQFQQINFRERLFTTCHCKSRKHQ